MDTPIASPPPSPCPSPPLPPALASESTSSLKRTRKPTRVRSFATRTFVAEIPKVHVEPMTGKAECPHRKKLRTYLGIVARDKVGVTFDNWKEVPAAHKGLIWENIQVI